LVVECEHVEVVELKLKLCMKWTVSHKIEWLSLLAASRVTVVSKMIGGFGLALGARRTRTEIR
jgi:hypothetical protein